MEAKSGDKFKTILVIVIGMLCLYLIFKDRYYIYAALVIGILSLTIPIVSSGIVKAWLKLSEVLGWFNSRILLGLVFFIVLTPVAVFSKLFRKDPLQLKEKDVQSLFRIRDHEYTAGDIENPW